MITTKIIKIFSLNVFPRTFELKPKVLWFLQVTIKTWRLRIKFNTYVNNNKKIIRIYYKATHFYLSFKFNRVLKTTNPVSAAPECPVRTDA